MDPALWELYEDGAQDDEVSVVLRLADPARRPDGIRVVAEFGPIVTARLRRRDIRRIWGSDLVASLKAPRPVARPSFPDVDDALPDADSMAEDADEHLFDEVELPHERGRGVVVGICDWGFDFTHANFRNPDGSTRLVALWDQRGGRTGAQGRYGYGRVYTREQIDHALTTEDPCKTLGYHPAGGDPRGTGAHGTHVADIAVGNRREPGSRVGLAGEADIVFVHLASERLSELANFGDSVRLLEGLDFVVQHSDGKPTCLHLSAGKTGGSHRGTTPFEQAVDWLLESRPGLVLSQSVGNYAEASTHTHARIGPQQSHTVQWVVARRDRTPNELEIWYSGRDVFEATLTAPTGERFTVPLGERAAVSDGTRAWGNFYHRRREPNSGLNHIDIFLRSAAPSGQWAVELRGREVVDGRMHAWIERDARGRHQSRFAPEQATSRYTTNTICNAFLSIAVGAYDGTRPDRPPTRFSSRGPTADGRQKPEVAAPGYRVLAARSRPREGWSGQRKLTQKSGTSMAAPRVSGTVALMFEAAGRPLSIHEVRRLLIGTADPHLGPQGQSSTRLGYGYLNMMAAVEAARALRGTSAPAPKPEPKPAPEPTPARTPRPPLESAAESIDPQPVEVMTPNSEATCWEADAAEEMTEGASDDAEARAAAHDLSAW